MVRGGSLINFLKNLEKSEVTGPGAITVLHAHIYSNFILLPCMRRWRAFNDGGSGNEFVGSLKQALEGRKQIQACHASG
jgi:hypothetical protein